MPVPASILQILETNNIAYQLMAEQHKPTSTPASYACLVKAMVLEDDHGMVQILYPHNRLLDLDALSNQFGRDLRRADLETLGAMLDKHRLCNVPAIPQWLDLPTIIDASLLEHTVVHLDTGDNELIELTQEAFCSVTDTSNIGKVAIQPPLISHAPEGDTEQITSSVQSFTQLRIKQRLEDTLELPPLPETAQRIIKLRADPNADISDLTNIVELDPSLSAQIVSWAGSPYYSAPGKIKSVHDAIVRVLGFDMVLNLALGLALGKTLNTSVMKDAQIREYWRISVCTAAVIEGLVTSIPREHRPAFGMSYLSGLLGNFGQLVVAEVFPPYYLNIMRHIDVNPHVSAASVEQHIIGVSSCQISAWLMEVWNMPEEVVVALRQQNNPDYEGDYKEYSQLLFVAAQMLARKGVGGQGALPIPAHVYEQLHLDPDTAEVTVDNILESADDLEAISEKMVG